MPSYALINIGTGPDTQTGDPLRTAMSKINLVIQDINSGLLGGGAGAGGNLDSLSDVAIGSLAVGHTVRYDGTTWRNAFLQAADIVGGGGGGATNLDALTDVVLTTPVAGQGVRHDGSLWRNANFVPGDIFGFNEAVDDRVAALLVQGTGITLTYSDVNNTLTIAATGGGAGGSLPNGNASGDVLVWNGSAWGAVTPRALEADRTQVVGLNAATALTFASHNRRRIVLTGTANLTLAAAEIGTAPNQGMEFEIDNHGTSGNQITFGAGITVVRTGNPGTSTGQIAKIASPGFLAVRCYPVSGALTAMVSGTMV